MDTPTDQDIENMEEEQFSHLMLPKKFDVCHLSGILLQRACFICCIGSGTPPQPSAENKKASADTRRGLLAFFFKPNDNFCGS